MMRRAFRLAPLPALISLALMTAFAVQATARDGGEDSTAIPLSPPPDLLNSITVTATRSPQKTFDIPGMVSVVDTGDAAVAGSSLLKNLLRDVPGIEFSGSARRNGQNIVMRGFSTDGLVILFDGVRQRGNSAHDGKFFIDPSLLKTVEVVRGPNSTLYGSGGLGGVVAFTTKDAADLLDSGQTWGAQTTLGQASVNDEWLVSQSAFMQDERVDLLVNVMTRNSEDIELGDGSRLSAQDHVASGLVKLDWTISPTSTLKLNAQLYNNDAEEPNNPQTTSNDDLVDKGTRSYQSSLTYRYFNPELDWLDLTAQVYYMDTAIDETEFNTGRDIGRSQENIGFSLQNQSRWEIGSRLANIFTYGFEIYSEEQNGSDSTGSGGQAGGIPDAETDFWGLFLQDEITLAAGPLPGDFLVIPGIRVDHYESDNATGLSLNATEASPKLGVTYRPADWLMLFGNYAHAFRAPTVTESFVTGIHFSIPGLGSNVFVPNPGLRPESSDTVEFGFGVQFDGLLTADDSLQFKASRFDTDGDDFIDLEVNFMPFPCCGTSRSSNVPKAELSGYEFEGGYENDRIRLGLSFSSVKGRNKDTGGYLRNITPPTLTTNLGVKLPEFQSMLGWRGRFAAQHDKVNDPVDARPGYGVHDLYYQWTPGRGSLVFNLGIDNVFDKDYERVFAGSPEPGRNFNMQVSYTW
ncbi:MAG: TonB-dependent hemoglobin/transferrin/lactoferrin family receptor [Pseudomonadales bacterium]|nr:TonB-dependent hemoglobin/transferrin/lactoferrin family receptor [Pseudomonadales bacterium]